MALLQAPEAVTSPIHWTVILSMTIAERQANEGSAMLISRLPVSGTITLANGWTRKAERLAGGRKTVLQYQTPAGNWRNATPAEAATFRPAS
jgi:hypothetical protein